MSETKDTLIPLLASRRTNEIHCCNTFGWQAVVMDPEMGGGWQLSTARSSRLERSLITDKLLSALREPRKAFDGTAGESASQECSRC